MTRVPAPETSDRVAALLEGLNPPQRDAVTSGAGPLLILAGAGSGKTRVLTHRIAYLLRTGQARADEILAITFTNKAAQEMRERVELLVGRATRAMWVMTFHSACARMLRADAHRLGYSRQFTIYDSADSRRLIKRCLDDLDIDPKRFTPRAMQVQISDAKNKLRAADAYRALVGSFFEQTVADVYESYERELHRANAMDFDDLLFRAVNLLELFQEVRDRYANAFRWVLVDEYQDTNLAQYRWLQLLSSEHRNLAVVGDDDQCLAEGTLVTMADGSEVPIELISPGDAVRTSYGGGRFGPAVVVRTARSEPTAGVRIRTEGGREIISTPEHTHFAGCREGRGRVDYEFASLSDANSQSIRRAGRRHAGVMTLCAGGSARNLFHAVSVDGDQRVATAFFRSTSEAMRLVRRLESRHDVTFRCVARLGATGRGEGDALPFKPAGAVRPGMVMFAEDGSYDVIESVEQIVLRRPVHDLDVERTHNFIAGGLVTHNSIYGFRGADIANILNFEDDYVDAHVVRLEQNYRSTQTILSAANSVVENNRGRKSKSLWTEIGEGDPIKVRELADEHAEARFVAAEIERLVDEGVSRAELAVFYRTNAQSRVLEDMLVRAQIGYQVIGGTKFYERAEVKDAVSYLTFLVNPADGGAFTRIANSPKRGIGQTSLSRVLAHADTMGLTPWEAAAGADTVPTLGTAAVRALGRFMSTMERVKERVDAGARVGDVMEELLRETGYLDALEAERTIEAQGRIENLEELVRVGKEYDATAGGQGEEAGVAQFLQQIALLSDADAIRDDEGLVTLMTLHNAKGLEFPIVFIIGCEDGVFPHSRALDEGALEEERRLAYVGITRAMRELYITYARRRNVFGSESFGLRSRFIDEIPRELTDQPDRNAVGIGRPAGAGRVASWATAAAAAAETLSTRVTGSGDGAGQVFHMGDDVVHAAFGEGVVLGVEPGGIVVVRFASDGSQRKLMADYAPIRRR